MNYSNSQRAGVILYLTASLFGGYVTFEQFRFFKDMYKLPEPCIRQPAALCGLAAQNQLALPAILRLESFESPVEILPAVFEMWYIQGSSRVMVGKKYPQPQCLC